MVTQGLSLDYSQVRGGVGNHACPPIPDMFHDRDFAPITPVSSHNVPQNHWTLELSTRGVLWVNAAIISGPFPSLAASRRRGRAALQPILDDKL